jgi:hypothetical protein
MARLRIPFTNLFFVLTLGLGLCPEGSDLLRRSAAGSDDGCRIPSSRAAGLHPGEGQKGGGDQGRTLSWTDR